MYLTVHELALDLIRGAGIGNGLGIPGLRRAPLNLIMKKKQPRNTPCGAEPGNDLGDEVFPLYLRIMLLSVKYDIRILRSQPGTFIS